MGVGGTFKPTPNLATSVSSEMHLEPFFFPPVRCRYHPTGCKGLCPLRNVKSIQREADTCPGRGRRMSC